MKGVKWKKYLLSSRAIFLGAFVALFWAILGLIPQNASAASLSTASFDIRAYNGTYNGASYNGWHWLTGITYGAYNSNYVNLTRTNAWQWNTPSITPTGNTATIHFETNIVFSAFSRNYLRFQNLQNFTLSAASSVGSINTKGYSLSYALTDWTCSNGAPCTTLTIYGDVVFSNVQANTAQVFTIQVLNANTFFYTDVNNANTANVWFEQNPATIIYSNDLTDSLLQTQINQQATIINLNGQMITNQQATTDAINSQNQQQHSDSLAEQQKQQATTDAINRTNDFLTDTTAPNVNASGLGNTAGWLPAGPVDSILTLPVQLAQGIVNVFTNPGQCSPIQLPLPWVDYTLELPCVGPLMDQVGFTPIWNIIGGVISAFIIYNTLKWLYKFVDDTLTLRENKTTMWGGL